VSSLRKEVDPAPTSGTANLVTDFVPIAGSRLDGLPLCASATGFRRIQTS